MTVSANIDFVFAHLKEAYIEQISDYKGEQTEQHVVWLEKCQ